MIMSDMQAKLGKTLLKSMVEVREEKGTISLQDVGEIFMDMAESLNPDHSNVDKFVHEEIETLAKYILDTKKEIFAIQTNDKAEDVIMDASAHLDEVIKHTEEATNTIMDACDKVQAGAAGIGGEKEAQIMDAANRIYDACTFQDITGQRIRKVIKLLENIEERINKLNGLLGTAPVFAEDAKNGSAKIDAANVVVPINDKDLLNGPQLAGQGTSQNDIDALFASLGGKS